MLPAWAKDTITVVEPSWIDDRGTLVPDYDTPACTTEVGGCSVQPGASEEVLAGRQNVTVRHTVYAPADAPVTAHSAVEWQGVRHSVDGDPAKWPHPSGGYSHLIIALVDWRG